MSAQTHSQTMQTILRARIVPAVRLRTEEQILRALEALLEGGIPVAEIAMSAPARPRFLEAAIDRYGDRMLLGAGTVLDEATARMCIAAGASFLVSPALNLDVIRCARRYGVPALPGALTPTEILSACEAGAEMVKLFPASALGGPAYLRAVRAPLPQVLLMPMGGVNVHNAEEYLRAGAAALGIGSDLVRQDEFEPGTRLGIAERAAALRECVARVHPAAAEHTHHSPPVSTEGDR